MAIVTKIEIHLDSCLDEGGSELYEWLYDTADSLLHERKVNACFGSFVQWFCNRKNISHGYIDDLEKDPTIGSAFPTSAHTVVSQHIVSVMGTDATASQVLVWP